MNEDDTGKTFLFLAIFNVLLLGAVFAIGLGNHKRTGWDPCGHSQAAAGARAASCAELAPEQAPDEGRPIVTIDDLTVQVKPFEEDHYVRLSVGLELDTKPSEAVVSRRTIQIRDIILKTFADRTHDELRGSAGLASLKQSLMRQLDQLVPGQRIRAIYVTQFAML
jgi:flagellar basal body-associated protein FliL